MTLRLDGVEGTEVDVDKQIIVPNPANAGHSAEQRRQLKIPLAERDLAGSGALQRPTAYGGGSDGRGSHGFTSAMIRAAHEDAAATAAMVLQVPSVAVDADEVDVLVAGVVETAVGAAVVEASGGEEPVGRGPNSGRLRCSSRAQLGACWPGACMHGWYSSGDRRRPGRG